LYDGRVEDWIETCTNLFSQDIKRLVSYSLKSFRLASKNVEFARSIDYNFFLFLLSLLLKLLFKLDDNSLKQVYFNNKYNRNSVLIHSILNFAILRNRREDLIVRKSATLLKFFLRTFCLMFYQTPLYNHLVGDLKRKLFNVVKLQPSIVVLGCENKNVTSNFISRFLARKLAQKYK
jgi:hypothetical protein